MRRITPKPLPKNVDQNTILYITGSIRYPKEHLSKFMFNMLDLWSYLPTYLDDCENNWLSSYYQYKIVNINRKPLFRTR